jgi:hypothetical protein
MVVKGDADVTMALEGGMQRADTVEARALFETDVGGPGGVAAGGPAGGG